MSLFDRFRKKSGDEPAEAVDKPLRQKLVELVMSRLREPDGRIRIEDAISAAATIVGERCIDATGDFPLRDHDLTPGSRFFSVRANQLICGDASDCDLSKVPKESIVGILRSRLDPRMYADAEFPPLRQVFEQFAARIGNPADWGKVPLSVPKDHLPLIPPLQVGYETRTRVDDVLHPIREDRARCLRIATESLAEILTMAAPIGDHKLVLTLAIETINGMAKTAPMTTKAMQKVQQTAARKTE